MLRTVSSRDLPDLDAAQPLERAGLTGRILSALERVHSVLVAPPGSGKSVAIDQVEAAAADHGWRVARLSVRQGGLDGPAIDAAIDGASTSGRQERTLVIVDDSGGESDGLAMAMEMQDPAVRFLLAVRQAGGLPLQKWQADGRVELWGGDDLRFTRMCLNHPQASFLSDRESSWLIENMAGWPVAYRALISARMRDPAGNAEATIRHALVGLSEYIEEQIFSGLDVETAQFLMETAALQKFDLTAVRDICGRSEFGSILDQILRWNLFINTIDPIEGVFAYHKGFASIAASRLARQDYSRKLELHQKAAIFYLERSQGLRAIKHARATKDNQFADRIEESAGGWRLGLKVGPKLFGPPVEAKEESPFPNVNLGRAYMLARDGRLTEARVLLERFKGSDRAGADGKTNPDAAGTDLYFAVMDSVFRLYEDRPVRSFERALLASIQREFDAGDSVLTATICSVNALICINEGRYRDAMRSCELGLLRAVEEELPYIEYYLRIKYGTALVALGFMEKAAEQLDQALEVSRKACGERSVEYTAAKVLRGGLHYEQNELPEAERLFQECFYPFLPTNGWYDFYKEGASAAATLSCLTDSPTDTVRVIEDCRSLSRIKGLWRLGVHADILEIRDLLRNGRVDEAMSRLSSPRIVKILRVLPDRLAPWLRPLAIAARLEKCRALVFLGRYQDAGDELKTLTAAQSANEDVRTQLLYDILVMEVNFQTRQYQAAVNTMEKVIVSARKYGLIRRLMNHAHAINKVAAWCGLNNWPLSPDVRSVIDDRLSGAASEQTPVQRTWAAGTENAVSRLSPREATILELLADGLSNKEIALRLEIAEGTVKSHRKKIYQKLGANTRATAIRRARESLLL